MCVCVCVCVCDSYQKITFKITVLENVKNRYLMFLTKVTMVYFFNNSRFVAQIVTKNFHMTREKDLITEIRSTLVGTGRVKTFAEI